MIKRNDEFSIKELITLLMPKLWIVIIIALVVGALFGAYSAFLVDDTYTSKAKIHIVKQNSSMNSGDMDVVSKVIEDYKVLINTEMFLNYVMQDIMFSPDYQESWQINNAYISSHLNARGVTDDIIEISVTTDNMIKSHLIATVVSEVIIEKSSEIFAFGDSLSLKILNPSIHNPANSKHVVRNTFIGFSGGMFISILAIFIISQFDIIVRDKKKLEETFNLPIIGVIPRYNVEEERENV